MLSDYSDLRSTELLDCHGRVSHRLTLLFDGNVEILFSNGRVAVVDPHRRVCLTPGTHVPEGMWTDVMALSR